MKEDNFYALAALRDAYASRFKPTSLDAEIARLTKMAEKALEDDEREERA